MDGHDIPAVSVDVVIVDADDVLLIRRAAPPARGMWALPGGFVEYGERVEDAARREAQEETRLAVRIERLVGVYSAPERDPRHHTISIAFLARPADPAARDRARGADDAAEARWFPLADLPPLAFDHDDILRDAKAILGRPFP